MPRWKHITDVVKASRDQLQSGDLLPLKPVSRESIEKLSTALRELPPAKLVTKHYWANGMYVRELFLPAGTAAVGKIHKAEHVFIVVAGMVCLVAEDGTPQTVEPPFVIVSPPGTRRAAFAITDTTMLTIQRTDLTDLEQIERELIEEDPGSLLDWDNKLKQPRLDKPKA